MIKAAIYVISIGAWISFILSLGLSQEFNLMVGATIPPVVSAAYEIGLFKRELWRH